MEIEVGLNNDVILPVDIQDNLKLPKKDQFAFVLRKPSKFKLGTEGMTQIVEPDGQISLQIDKEANVRMWVYKILNPPILNPKDGEPRELTLTDVLNLPELDEVAIALAKQIRALEKDATKGVLETKNS